MATAVGVVGTRSLDFDDFDDLCTSIAVVTPSSRTKRRDRTRSKAASTRAAFSPGRRLATVSLIASKEGIGKVGEVADSLGGGQAYLGHL